MTDEEMNEICSKMRPHLEDTYSHVKNILSNRITDAYMEYPMNQDLIKNARNEYYCYYEVIIRNLVAQLITADFRCRNSPDIEESIQHIFALVRESIK